MTTTLNVTCPDIECEGCAGAIHRSVEAVQGVQGVKVDVQGKRVAVEYDPAQVSDSQLRERLNRAGFPPQ
jgi:copper chaperone CopZ